MLQKFHSFLEKNSTGIKHYVLGVRFYVIRINILLCCAGRNQASNMKNSLRLCGLCERFIFTNYFTPAALEFAKITEKYSGLFTEQAKQNSAYSESSVRDIFWVLFFFSATVCPHQSSEKIILSPSSFAA